MVLLESEPYETELAQELLDMSAFVISTSIVVPSQPDLNKFVTWKGQKDPTLTIAAYLKHPLTESSKLVVLLSLLQVDYPDFGGSVFVNKMTDMRVDNPIGNFVLDSFREHYHKD